MCTLKKLYLIDTCEYNYTYVYTRKQHTNMYICKKYDIQNIYIYKYQSTSINRYVKTKTYVHVNRIDENK